MKFHDFGYDKFELSLPVKVRQFFSTHLGINNVLTSIQIHTKHKQVLTIITSLLRKINARSHPSPWYHLIELTRFQRHRKWNEMPFSRACAVHPQIWIYGELGKIAIRFCRFKINVIMKMVTLSPRSQTVASGASPILRTKVMMMELPAL